MTIVDGSTAFVGGAGYADCRELLWKIGWKLLEKFSMARTTFLGLTLIPEPLQAW